ncbi:hypothetical protein [Alicyclobacillus macrosporangiidus]|uniref:Uncharacterized protein n=1 Tax=Alicyclobacillus macrosporangiidus TaxID=392015 RepID=A0A1I7KD31_9BACL|nr:hypothetical protein [Alicyclobacillus macrosporangiidus]SFU95343.1 hypothetical protein SAMN05421543_11544 [Alicyclobacillus macrosporangiidus]
MISLDSQRKFTRVVEEYARETEQSVRSVVLWLSKRPVDVSAALLGLGGLNGEAVSKTTLKDFQSWLSEMVRMKR